MEGHLNVVRIQCAVEPGRKIGIIDAKRTVTVTCSMDTDQPSKIHINRPSFGSGVHQRHRVDDDGIFATRYEKRTFHFDVVDKVVDSWPLSIDISDLDILCRPSRFQSKSTSRSIKAVEKLLSVCA